MRECEGKAMSGGGVEFAAGVARGTARARIFIGTARLFCIVRDGRHQDRAASPGIPEPASCLIFEHPLHCPSTQRQLNVVTLCFGAKRLSATAWWRACLTAAETENVVQSPSAISPTTSPAHHQRRSARRCARVGDSGRRSCCSTSLVLGARPAAESGCCVTRRFRCTP